MRPPPKLTLPLSRQFLSNIYVGSTHLSTWIGVEEKQRFACVAARQGLSASAFLKRLVEQVLAASGGDEAPSSIPVPIRDARITIRLNAEDHALLRERAAARTMPSATYVSALVRAHLRGVAPLPDRELEALQSTVRELAAFGRNVNAMTRLLHQGNQQAVPGRVEVHAMLRICEGLRDYVRGLIKENLTSWGVGRATSDR